MGAPDNPEFAIGSVDESGNVYLNRDLQIDPTYIDTETQAQLLVLQHRRKLIQASSSTHSSQRPDVIIVDNGIATGFTVIAAIHAVKVKTTHKNYCGDCSGTTHVVTEIAAIADEVVCLETPTDFRSVGRFYRDFHQVSDQEVTDALM